MSEVGTQILVTYICVRDEGLRHCTSNRKVTCSILDGLIRIFFIELILPAAFWPYGRINLYRK